MIKTMFEESIEVNGKEYMVGEIVRVNGQSIYEGMQGVILMIHTDEDKDTDNMTDDIYVEFGRDNVMIMAPEMLDPTGITLGYPDNY